MKSYKVFELDDKDIRQALIEYVEKREGVVATIKSIRRDDGPEGGFDGDFDCSYSCTLVHGEKSKKRPAFPKVEEVPVE